MKWMWQLYRRFCLSRKAKQLSALRFASLVQQIEQMEPATEGMQA